MTQAVAARSVVVLDDAVPQSAALDALFAQSGLAVARVVHTDQAPGLAGLEQAALIVLRIDTSACCARLAALRGGGLLMPVVAIGAAADQTLALSAYAAGVDALLGSPADIAELLARCRALLRRSPVAARETVAGELQLDLQGKTASIGAERLDLSPMQFAVLEQLARRPGQVTTRQLLLDRLYAGVDTPAPSVIDFFIHALRRRLAACKSTLVIETVRGVGFRLSARASLREA